MAIDLFSLQGTVTVAGIPQAQAALSSLEVTGVRTAAALNGIEARGVQQAVTPLRQTEAAAKAATVETAALGAGLGGIASKAIPILAVGASFVALGGLILSSAREAAQGEVVQERLRAVVEAAGISWAYYGRQLMGATTLLQLHSTFSDTQATVALASLIPVTRDVAEATRLLGVAADLATFKHISLESAAQIVARTLAGNTRQMKEFGITTTDGAEAVRQLAEILGGQAAAAAGTFTGHITGMTNAWHTFKQTLGDSFIGDWAKSFLDLITSKIRILTSDLLVLKNLFGEGGISPSNRNEDWDPGQVWPHETGTQLGNKAIRDEPFAGSTGKPESEEARLRRLMFRFRGQQFTEAPDRLEGGAGFEFGGVRTDRIDTSSNVKRLLDESAGIQGDDGGRRRRGEDSPVFRQLLQSGEALKDEFALLGTNLGMTLADGFAAALGAAIHGKNPFKAFGNVVLAGLGSIFKQMGQKLIAFGVTMLKLLPFLSNPFTSGPAAIAAGIALTALGIALGSIAHSGDGGGGGGGGGGGFAQRDQVTNVTLTRDGAGGAKPPASGMVVYQPIIIGPNDPTAQRGIVELMQNASDRNIRVKNG